MVTTKEIISDLLLIANDLDMQKFYTEADTVTKIAKSLTSKNVTAQYNNQMVNPNALPGIISMWKTKYQGALNNLTNPASKSYGNYDGSDGGASGLAQDGARKQQAKNTVFQEMGRYNYDQNTLNAIQQAINAL